MACIAAFKVTKSPLQWLTFAVFVAFPNCVNVKIKLMMQCLCVEQNLTLLFALLTLVITVLFVRQSIITGFTTVIINLAVNMCLCGGFI